MFQKGINVLWDVMKELWAMFQDWFTATFLGDDGIFVWLFGLMCDAFEFLFDKVPDIVLPASTAAAVKSVMGYVALLNTALPVFEGFAILLVVFSLWSIITLIRIVIKLIPTIG